MPIVFFAVCLHIDFSQLYFELVVTNLLPETPVLQILRWFKTF